MPYFVVYPQLRCFTFIGFQSTILSSEAFLVISYHLSEPGRR